MCRYPPNCTTECIAPRSLAGSERHAGTPAAASVDQQSGGRAAPKDWLCQIQGARGQWSTDCLEMEGRRGSITTPHPDEPISRHSWVLIEHIQNFSCDGRSAHLQIRELKGESPMRFAGKLHFYLPLENNQITNLGAMTASNHDPDICPVSSLLQSRVYFPHFRRWATHSMHSPGAVASGSSGEGDRRILHR